MKNNLYNPFSLFGKSILITGASSGIGKAIALECSKMGASVIILGRDKKRLLETFSQLIPNINNKYFLVDISCEDQINSLIDKIESIDGMVNAAGILIRGPFKFIKEVDLDETINVNFKAPTLFVKKLISKNKIKNGSSIVFISSISGSYCSFIGNSVYSASKGALNAMAKSMAIELSNKKIRVNTIHPGMVSTNMHLEKSFDQEDLIKDLDNYPLKRYGEPVDVAYGTIFLLSNASSWITGSSLLIDGGYTLK